MGGEESIGYLIDRFEPDVFYGFDPLLDKETVEPYFELRKSVAWVEDGETRLSGGVLNDSTVMPNSHMWKTTGFDVPCFDFSSWMKRQGPAVVKMDIEGAEFPILEKMIHDGTHTLIELLLVEWHERWIPGGDDRRAAIEKQLTCPIEIWP